MSSVMLIGLSVQIAFLCAFSLAEWAANRLAHSLREQRRKALQRDQLPDLHYPAERARPNSRG